MLNLPHPLLSHGIDIHCLLGNSRVCNVETRPPREHHQRDQKRYDGPRDLKTYSFVDLFCNPSFLTSILDGEKKNESKDQDGKEGRDSEQKEIKKVHASRDRRCHFRKKRKPHHVVSRL